MIKQIMIISILTAIILFLGYLGIEYLIAQLISDVFAQIEGKQMNTKHNLLLKQKWDLIVKLKKAQRELEISIKKTKRLNNV